MSDITPLPKVPQRLNKRGHPWGCTCRPCIGSRNRRRGMEKQRKAAKSAGVKPRRVGDLGNEERYPRSGLAESFKLEHKSGKLSKFILDAIHQIERDRAIGDPRPALVQLTPENTSTVYVVLRQDDLINALNNQGPDGAFHIRAAARDIIDLAHQIEMRAT